MKIEQRMIALSPMTGNAKAQKMLQVRMVADCGTVLGQETVQVRGRTGLLFWMPEKQAVKVARHEALKQIETQLADLVKQKDKQR